MHSRPFGLAHERTGGNTKKTTLTSVDLSPRTGTTNSYVEIGVTHIPMFYSDSPVPAEWEILLVIRNTSGTASPMTHPIPIDQGRGVS